MVGSKMSPGHASLSNRDEMAAAFGLGSLFLICGTLSPWSPFTDDGLDPEVLFSKACASTSKFLVPPAEMIVSAALATVDH